MRRHLDSLPLVVGVVGIITPFLHGYEVWVENMLHRIPVAALLVAAAALHPPSGTRPGGRQTVVVPCIRTGVIAVGSVSFVLPALQGLVAVLPDLLAAPVLAVVGMAICVMAAPAERAVEARRKAAAPDLTLAA